MKVIYYLSNIFWLGLVGLIGTYFSDSVIFKYLCFCGVFAFLNLAFNFVTIKDSILQIIGILKIKLTYGKIPNLELYKTKGLYSLPFDGAWVCVNGCVSKEYSHSWNIPAQRYAYDFIILDENNESHRGDIQKMDSYYCYNREILAPADGTVIKIMNKSDDSSILKRAKFIVHANNIAGNYIIIKHFENEYSLLAHLKKDSFTVKEGECVSRGQVVALCGNSGNSSEPHLHFQIQNGESFYNSLGVPILFRDIYSFKINGYKRYDNRKYMNFEEIPKQRVTRGHAYANRPQ
ncbi:M23 family metallopeptidase [Peptostreptococcus sp. D1]|uniref:M23 family metallopeptidase n=1 Tax=Peptostreptococcus sp. D1 TaxID=72304 RepID=UPI0008E1173E|nr:M23 family metallopeptidase [Peptostreptococcus sp. D1]SFE60936.1 Peptidase family M23 [Peptostreptococcus sp. D1]